jgi:hypothetical protein
MTLKLDKNVLSIKELNEIKNDCFIEGEENNYGPGQKLKAYAETSTSIYIPFSYGKKRYNKSPNKEINFPKTDYIFYKEKYPFRTDGGRDQEIVFNETIQLLKKHKSALLSLYCSYGKCHKIDTPIIMYDGSIKLIQNIIPGDKLMGDDSTPRNVLSICNGIDIMYKIIPDNGDTFIVNQYHILCLKVVKEFLNYKLNENIEINIIDYLNLLEKYNLQVRMNLLLYKVSVDFSYKMIYKDPYLMGNYIEYYEYIPFNYKCNNEKIRLLLLAGIIDNYGEYSFNKDINRYQFIINIINKLKLKQDIIFLIRSLGYITYQIDDKIICYGNNLNKIPVLKFNII